MGKIKYSLDKRVAFVEESHSYYDSETADKYTSVTTVIGKFGPKFDEDWWAEYKAVKALDEGLAKELYRGKYHLSDRPEMTSRILQHIELDVLQSAKDVVLQSWETDRVRACEKGTIFHKGMEDYFLKTKVLPFNGILYKYDKKLSKPNTFCLEALLYDSDTFVAGQSDVLLRTGDRLDVLDYKTNKDILKKAFNNEIMYYPLNHLYNNKMNIYNIQLSVYMRLGCRMFDLEPGNCYIYWNKDGDTDQAKKDLVTGDNIFVVNYLDYESECVLNYKNFIDNGVDIKSLWSF